MTEEKTKLVCEHEWELIDDSFDHELGCEQIIYWYCPLCDEEKDWDSKDEPHSDEGDI